MERAWRGSSSWNDSFEARVREVVVYGLPRGSSLMAEGVCVRKDIVCPPQGTGS
jgi:hypothetical protein